MKERTPIIDNPVYSEILIKINSKKVYSVELSKNFKNKERSVLSRQLKILVEEGFLFCEEYSKDSKNKNKKFKGNLKYYSINKVKILDVFYKALIYYLTDDCDGEFSMNNLLTKLRQQKFIESGFIRVKIKTEEEFKNKFFTNPIILDYVFLLLEETNEKYDYGYPLKNITLFNLFLNLLQHWAVYSMYDSFLYELKKKGVLDEKYSDENLLFINEFIQIAQGSLGIPQFYEVSSASLKKLTEKYSSK